MGFQRRSITRKSFLENHSSRERREKKKAVRYGTVDVFIMSCDVDALSSTSEKTTDRKANFLRYLPEQALLVADSSDNAVLRSTKMLRILRLARLIKLARLLKFKSVSTSNGGPSMVPIE